MPRRRQDQPILSSDQVGSDNPEPTSIELAQVGAYPVTDDQDYRDMPPEWKKAYDRAAQMRNTVKASLLFADSQMQKYEDGDAVSLIQTAEEIDAEIQRLTEQKERLEA